MKMLSIASLGGVVLCLGGVANAQIDGVERARDADPPLASPTETAVSTGAFLPFSQAAALEGRRGYGIGFAGYDSARKTATFEASTELQIWGPIAVRGGAVYTNGDKSLRPSFGARIQILRQERHSVDGALGVFYRPEGLTEPEGEIESVLSIGGLMGRTYLLGNLLYGQDPEGSERDGEMRLALLHPIKSRVLLGFDGRLRFDLGSQAARLAQHHEGTMDIALGPTIALVLGPIAVSLEAGGSALRTSAVTSYGAFTMTGVATAF